jgi:hypothetical protein
LLSQTSLLKLGFTHQDSQNKLRAKCTINAANHILIARGDRAQVPIVHDDMVVRDNVQSDNVVYNNVFQFGGGDNIVQSDVVYDNIVPSVAELTKALHFALQLIFFVRQDSVH